MSCIRLLVPALALWIALPSHAAVIVVDTTADGVTGPLCDIRDAINAANTDQESGGCQEVTPNGADVIDLRGLTGSIDLDSMPLRPLPTIQESVTLRGPGADRLRIDGLDATQILLVENGTLTIEGLTIANGTALRGGCIAVNDAGLVLRDSRVTSCSASNGGAIALDSAAVALVERSLIDASTTTDDSGAGILNSASTVEVVDSTVSGNVANEDTGAGGGIATFGNDGIGLATTRIHSSTLADNGASSGGNLYTEEGPDIDTILTHVLLADPQSGGNCAGGAVTSLGFNLATDGSCDLDADTDKPNTIADIDPALADNGGPTRTHAVLPGSAAIDGGDPAGCLDPDGFAIGFDQRGEGFPRRTDANDDGSYECDIGAFETVPEPLAGLAGVVACAALALSHSRGYPRSSQGREQEEPTRCTSRSATR